jgi:hypothetical protein
VAVCGQARGYRRWSRTVADVYEVALEVLRASDRERTVERCRPDRGDAGNLLTLRHVTHREGEIVHCVRIAIARQCQAQGGPPDAL